MSDSSTGDKTEKPSQQKLRKVREQGQVPRSRDWATAVGLLVSLKLFIWLMPGYLEDFRTMFALIFVPLDGDGAYDNAWSDLFGTTMLLLLKMMAPLLVVPVLVSLATLYPGGWIFNGGNLLPKLERMSPAKNLGRLVSGKHWSEFATSLLKAVALGLVLWHVATSSVADYLDLQAQTLDQALLAGAELMQAGVMALLVVFVVFAFIDVPLQAFFFMRQQRMSKQDLKEEHKSAEGRPEVRARVRQLQRQMAQRTVRKTVPTADVVIVNPEHYAVALKYDDARAEAPFVVAKGIDEMALYIRQVAQEHKIEIVPLPPLARAIYNTSQVQQQIPAPLYKAVALVLGYVLQIRAFQAGKRSSAPPLPGDLGVPAHLSEAVNP